MSLNLGVACNYSFVYFSNLVLISIVDILFMLYLILSKLSKVLAL